LILFDLALVFQIEFGIITGQFSKWLFGLVGVLDFLPLLYFIILVSKHLFACLIGWHYFQQKWTALQQYCPWMKSMREIISRRSRKKAPVRREGIS